MIGNGTFNFQTPEGTLRQNAAPPPAQPISLYPAHQATYSLSAEASKYPGPMQHLSAREPTPQNALPTRWKPPAALISKNPSPVIHYDDPDRDPRGVQSARTYSNVDPPPRTPQTGLGSQSQRSSTPGLSPIGGARPSTPPTSAELGFLQGGGGGVVYSSYT